MPPCHCGFQSPITIKNRHLSALEPARFAHVCSPSLQTTPLPNPTLAEFYRFALLLTGSIKTAEQVMADTLAEVATQVAQVRNETGRQAWFVQRIRERCLKNNESAPPAAPRLNRTNSTAGEKPRVLKIEAFLLAQRFHTLPEPERSALALFYLDFFTIAEIAELLKMSIETLSETLDAARKLLEHSLRAAGKHDSTKR
jgi:DNA-directed RNA polymerase specialized sigma24 family protein